MPSGSILSVRLSAVALVFALGAAAARASEEPLPPVSERYAPEKVQEVPSFQRHVSPLFGRLGCNGRSCHGSFQGQGDFRLSLFGYDFKADHDELLKGDPPRANRDQPHESLILVKPTDEDMHEGGQRYQVGSWEHHLFRRWLEAGAKFDEKTDVQKLVTLEVTPAELLFDKPGETTQLQAVAVWPDGTREDVTCLCRFTSNSDQVATISENGLVTATDPGDTHVVVAYDNAVVAIPVIRPVSQLTGERYPDVPTPTKIDELVVQKLKKLGVVPSDLANDAEFLRRVSLDLTGTLPTAAEVEAFLADESPTKRADKVEELLKTPAYVAWWTTRLCDWTGNNNQRMNNFGPGQGVIRSQQWYDWIYERVASNMPYDKLAEGIILATSREEGESYAEFCETMSKIAGGAEGASFAERSSMPYYWVRQNFVNADDRAIGFAYTFMGIRIQCAQCHKHPFDQWSKADFDAFKNFFGTVAIAQQGRQAQDEYQKIVAELGLENSELRGNQLRNQFANLLRQGKTVPFPELISNSPTARRRPANNRNVATGPKARVLGGEEVDLMKHPEARQPLMDWLRQPDNPYFARAFVNRVWANYFNVGIVEPPDDLSLGNPPSNKPLLDYLTEGFVASGYDMQWLHREIISSRTYQLSWQPNETNAKDERNFARAVPRRIPAEVAVDALMMATASDERAARFRDDLDGRAVALAGASVRLTPGTTGFALQVFGRSVRDSNCDCDRSMDASLLQTVYLQNDTTVLQAVDGGRGSWIEQISPRAAGRPQTSDRGAGPVVRRQIANMEMRLEQATKNGNEAQVERITQRLADLKEAAGLNEPDDKPADSAAAADLKLDEPTLIRQAYLRTLSRHPSEDEIARCQQFLAEAESPLAGAKGLLWALINTKEFIVNH